MAKKITNFICLVISLYVYMCATVYVLALHGLIIISTLTVYFMLSVVSY